MDQTLLHIIGLYKLNLSTGTFTQDDIRKAYRLQSLKYHPDKCTDPRATEISKAINWAYGVLKDEQLFLSYLQTGRDALDNLECPAEWEWLDQQLETILEIENLEKPWSPDEGYEGEEEEEEDNENKEWIQDIEKLLDHKSVTTKKKGQASKREELKFKAQIAGLGGRGVWASLEEIEAGNPDLLRSYLRELVETKPRRFRPLIQKYKDLRKYYKKQTTQ